MNILSELIGLIIEKVVHCRGKTQKIQKSDSSCLNQSMRVSNVHYRGYNSPEQQFLFPPAAGGETFFIVFVLKSFFIQPVRVGLYSTPTVSISNSIIEAGLPPVGVNSAHRFVNFALKISFWYH